MPLYIVRDLHFSPRDLRNPVLAQLPAHRRVRDPVERRHGALASPATLALGAVLSGAGFGAMAFARDFWTLAATVVMWTLGEMLFFPASAAYATDIAPDARRGEYSGLYTMIFSVAFAIGPWAGTVVIERFGARVLWGATFLLGLIAAAVFVRLPEPLHHAEPPEQTMPDAAGPAEI